MSCSKLKKVVFLLKISMYILMYMYKYTFKYIFFCIQNIQMYTENV